MVSVARKKTWCRGMNCHNVVLVWFVICVVASSLVGSSFAASGESYSLSAYGNTKSATESNDDAATCVASSLESTTIENPFASGISEDDVNFLVGEVMKDPEINIKLIPDVLERQVYRMTITVVLNAIYGILAEHHGRNLPAGHCLKLGRRKSSISKKRIQNYYLESIRDDNFNYEMLEQVAERMLANPAINSRFLPDGVEKQLYYSCLKLIFRLLGMVAISTRISLCGHEIRLHITKAAMVALQSSAIQSANTTMTTIDTEHIEEFAREAGLKSGVSKHWFFGRQRQEFMIQLQASLYGLILGIVDDVLFNTRLELLSDRVRLDVVPTDDPEMMAYRKKFGYQGGIIQPTEKAAEEEEEEVIADVPAISLEASTAVTTESKKPGRMRPFIASFAFGVGTGLSLMASFQNIEGAENFLGSAVANRKKALLAIFEKQQQKDDTDVEESSPSKKNKFSILRLQKSTDQAET